VGGGLVKRIGFAETRRAESAATARARKKKNRATSVHFAPFIHDRFELTTAPSCFTMQITKT
jgi:hypothetical protein